MRQIAVSPKDRPASIDPGPAPMLQWLKIADLVVDDSYQRELGRGNWTSIRKIAAAFKWSRFSPVFVAPVEGGRYAIIDGQHRTHAAAMCGLSEVPCQVVPMTGVEQAASFAAVNGLVTKVTIWQIFKAALAAGEDWAVACDQAVSGAGCRLMLGNNPTDQKKPGQIYALGLVRGYVEAGKSAMLTYAFDALRRCEAGTDAAMWSNEILKPLLSAIVDRPFLLKSKADLGTFLDDFDIYQAIDEAEEEAKRKRRMGFSGVSRYDFAAARIGDALDRKFARRVA